MLRLCVVEHPEPDSQHILRMFCGVLSCFFFFLPTFTDYFISLFSFVGTTERRITTTTSIKLQSPAPSTPQVASAVSYPKSRLSRQVQLTRSQQQEEDLDADAEGEEDLEGDDAEDDLTPYCFCHKPSFGDVSHIPLSPMLLYLFP